MEIFGSLNDLFGDCLALGDLFGDFGGALGGGRTGDCLSILDGPFGLDGGGGIIESLGILNYNKRFLYIMNF